MELGLSRCAWHWRKNLPRQKLAAGLREYQVYVHAFLRIVTRPSGGSGLQDHGTTTPRWSRIIAYFAGSVQSSCNLGLLAWLDRMCELKGSSVPCNKRMNALNDPMGDQGLPITDS